MNPCFHSPVTGFHDGSYFLVRQLPLYAQQKCRPVILGQFAKALMESFLEFGNPDFASRVGIDSKFTGINRIHRVASSAFVFIEQDSTSYGKKVGRNANPRGRVSGN